MLTVVSGQIIVAEAALAQPQSEIEAGFQPHRPIAPSTQPTTTVAEWMAQIEAALIQITRVRLEDTEAGLRVILETADGELAVPTTTVSGNALIAEIPNAVLALLEGEEFQQFEPAEGIALVQVTGLPSDRVQVVITGADAPPTAEVSTVATGLTLSIEPGVAQANAADEVLRVVVTGEERSRYVVPNATTATRTDTPLRDVPQSIQVIPQEVLEDQQVFRLNDALRNVSGVTSASNDPRGQRFNVRGFNDTTQLRDGFRISVGAQNIGFQELSNIEQIEVLKGPASILFGAVEPGGVINLVSEQPLSEPFYDLSLRVGNRGLLEPSLDFSGPLTEDGRLLYRLNALYRTEDSFRDYDTEIERSFIAPTISWQISDRTDLTLYFEYSDDERPADFGIIPIGDEVADIPFDRILGEPEDRITAEFLRTGYQFEHRFSDNWKLRNAFSYASYDNAFEAADRVLAPPPNETTGEVFRRFTRFEFLSDFYELQTNVVGEFSTGPIDHTLLFGVDLFRREAESLLQADFNLLPPLDIFDPVYRQTPRPDFESLAVTLDQFTQTDLLGVYLQDQIAFADNLKLLAGLRYETFEQEVVNNPTDFVPTGSESRQTGDAFSPRIGLVYQPIEEVSLFASYSRSFSPNTGTTFDGDLLEPEEGEQFEVGVKAELWEGRLSASLAYFDITLENVQTRDPDNSMFFIATGQERSQGVELDVIGEILPGWNLVANYAYIDARITEDDQGLLEGNRRFSVPNHNFNLWTSYDIQNGPLEGLGFGLGFNFVGERFGDNANSYELDNYFLTNAAISYQHDNWRAGLNIRNLFDVDYIESTNGNRFAAFPGEGFTLIGSFAIEF
ncbi:MAG: TonB-dependent receptor [Cyanobacteria bacterium P01_H01_bin.58]